MPHVMQIDVVTYISPYNRTLQKQRHVIALTKIVLLLMKLNCSHLLCDTRVTRHSPFYRQNIVLDVTIIVIITDYSLISKYFMLMAT